MTRRASALGFHRIVLATTATFIVGCATNPDVAAPTQVGELPDTASGSVRYVVDAEASDIELRIYRGGRLARLGHNHVIEIPDFAGDVYYAPEPAASTGSFRFAVASMKIDDPARRQAAGEGFESEPSDKDIAGTRENMLSDRLLDGAAHPDIKLAIGAIAAAESDGVFTVSMLATVKDATYDFEVPATINRNGRQLTVTGEFTVLQTALGLTPFSVMLGALLVEDNIDVRYRIVATAVDDS
ncbi:MAG: YceI family protein [Pseudomonadota bacterium]